MNTAAALFCQTGGREKFTHRALWRAVAAACGLHLCAFGHGVLAESPAWQSELNALRLSEATVALLPPARAAEATEADRRLGDLFRQLAARYPREVAIRKAAGDHFWRTGDVDTATSEWEAAQALDPADAETASSLGSARLHEGQTRRACEQFQRAVAARPDAARYHFELANVLYLFRHELTGLPSLPDEAATFHEALAQFRLARDLAPGSMEYARAYAETFYGVPDPDWHEALEAWERVRALSADAPDFVLGQLARVSLRLGQTDEAERYLAAIQDPRFADLRAALHQQAAELRRRMSASPP